MSGVKGINAGVKNWHYIHGETKTSLHKIWESMIERCEYKKHPWYSNYGGSGISVCPEWHDYIAFRNWALSNGYKDGLTIDRIDNERGYDPSNCRWSTMKEQQNNKRNNHRLHWNGECKTISEWSEITGIKKTTIKERVKAGWSISDVLTKPIRRRTRGYRPSGAEMRERVENA